MIVDALLSGRHGSGMITVATVVWPVVPVGSYGVQGGYNRQIRQGDGVRRLWVWRGYCWPCDVSHALLLVDFVVPHHLDTLDRIFALLNSADRCAR